MQVTVEVERITEKYTLRQFVGDGTYGEQEFVFSVGLPGMCPMVEVGGEKYAIGVREIVQAVIDEHNKEKCHV